MNSKRLIKTVILGAMLAVIYEYAITPYITKPIEKKVEDVIDDKS